MINLFVGQYRFLSNFFMVIVWFENEIYSSAEHAYQAAKSEHAPYRLQIRNCVSPGAAKRIGRTALLRQDWENIKLDIMEKIVRDKFFRHPSLSKALIATGDQELVEGNNWNDTFWGRCNGVGENHLGKILMKVRSELGAGQNRI